MKITIVHNDNKKQLLVSTKTMEKLLERIAKDDSKQSVTRFRDYAAYIDEDYRFYKDMDAHLSCRRVCEGREQQPEDEGL